MERFHPAPLEIGIALVVLMLWIIQTEISKAVKYLRYLCVSETQKPGEAWEDPAK